MRLPTDFAKVKVTRDICLHRVIRHIYGCDFYDFREHRNFLEIFNMQINQIILSLLIFERIYELVYIYVHIAHEQQRIAEIVSYIFYNSQ